MTLLTSDYNIFGTKKKHLCDSSSQIVSRLLRRYSEIIYCSCSKYARKMTNGRKNVIVTLEGSLFEDWPDKITVLKLTNVFLYASVLL